MVMLRLMVVVCLAWSSCSREVTALDCVGMLGTKSTVVLEKGRSLPVGVLRSLSVEFCSARPVHVQLWRPTESTVDSYKLVWHKLVNTSITGKLIVNLTTSEQIYVESDYRLGIQADAGRDSVPVVRRFFRANVIVSASPHPSLSRCNAAAFDQLQYPYMFAVELCTEPGCGATNLVSPGSDNDMNVWICPDEATTNAIRNERLKDNKQFPPIANTCHHMLQTGRKVLLEQWRPLPSGVVKSMSVEFCADGAVHVQLWRLTGSDVDSYTLVWDKLVNASTMTGKTIINLSSTEYIDIDATYRLGLQAAVGRQAIPVQKTFYSGNIITSLSSISLTRCESLVFDHLPYPYRFSVELCSHTGCGSGDDAINEESNSVVQTRWICPASSTTKGDRSTPTGVTPVTRLSSLEERRSSSDHASPTIAELCLVMCVIGFTSP